MTATRPGTLLTRLIHALGLLAAACFVALSLSPNSVTRFYQWPWFFYWQVLLMTPIAMLAAQLLFGRAPAGRFGGWLDAGLALLAASSVISAVLSPFRPQSLAGALLPVAAVCLAYLALGWIERDQRKRETRLRLLGRSIGFVMILCMLASLGGWLMADLLPQWKDGGSPGAALLTRNAHPFGHSVYVAGFAVLAAPWLVSLGLSASGRLRWFWLGAGAAAAAVIPTTSSRGGAFALAALLICAATLWLKHPATRHNTAGRGTRFLVVLGVLLAGGMLVGLNPRLRDLARERRWSEIASESNRQRIAMLKAGVLMGKDRPWTGYGPGTVSMVYPRHRAELSGGVDNVLQLHNTPAQLWAEWGALGLAAGLLILIGVERLARRSGALGWREGAAGPQPGAAPDECQQGGVILEGPPLRGPGTAQPVRRSPTDGAEAVPPTKIDGEGGKPSLQENPRMTPPCGRLPCQAIFVTFIGYSVMSLFDYQLDVPLFAATCALLLALWRACAPEAHTPAVGIIAPSRIQRVLGGLLLAGLGLMAWFAQADIRARALFADAADARSIGDDEFFLSGAHAAAETSPWEAFYLNQLAAFHGERYLRDGDANARDQCRRFLLESLARNPDQEYCHFNLGWLLLPSDPAKAEPHFRTAARLVPDKGGVYLGLGLSLLARNRTDTAIRAFALEWLNDPLSITSPLWEVPPLSAMRGEIAAAARREGERWLEAEALSETAGRRLRYVLALIDWWLGRTSDVAALIRYGTPVQRGFFENLAAVEQRRYGPAGSVPMQPWEKLYSAWRGGPLPPLPGNDDPAFMAAVRRRLDGESASFIRVLTAPVTAEPELVSYTRRQRPGYSVLARNQDGFMLTDLYIATDNRLVGANASFLFPPKGYLPGRLLVQNLAFIGGTASAPSVKVYPPTETKATAGRPRRPRPGCPSTSLSRIHAVESSSRRKEAGGAVDRQTQPRYLGCYAVSRIPTASLRLRCPEQCRGRAGPSNAKQTQRCRHV